MKKMKLLVIAASVAVVLALSIGGVAMAAGPDENTEDMAVYCGEWCRDFDGRVVYSDDVCGLLGMTADEIQDQRHTGKSLVEIAAAKGISEQQLVDVIMAERETEIQARVTEGILTQEQANIMLQQMEQNVISAVNRASIGKPEWAGIGHTAGNGCGDTGWGTGPGNMYRWGGCSR